MAPRCWISLLAAMGFAAQSVEATGPKVLMVLTSNDKLGDDDKKGITGWYLPEAAHPFFVFDKAGVDMTWASPKGGKAPVDESSVKAYQKDKECMKFLHDDKLKKLWHETKKLSDVDAKDYDAVFVVGGYGVMWDLVKNKDLEAIAASIYEHKGIVSGVCHGPAALVNVKLSDGSALIAHKKFACFTNAEEDTMKRRKVVPKTCEDASKSMGAKYKEGKAWSDTVATAGRLITGQNPMSAKSTAGAVVQALLGDAKVEVSPGTEEKFQVYSNEGGVQAAQLGNGMMLASAAGIATLAAVAVVGSRALRSGRRSPEAPATELLESGVE